MTVKKKNEFEMIKKGIREYAPLIADFFDYSKMLIEHSQSLYDFLCDPVHVQRQKCIADAITVYCSRVHGLHANVPLPMAINIMDHHSMINNPLSIATNIVANAHRLLSGDSRPIITFSTSIPPQDNYFSDVRFHGRRLRFFSKKELPQSTCFMSIHSFRCSDRLGHAGKWTQFTKNEQEFILNFEHTLASLDLGCAENLNDQVSILNGYLWKQLFEGSLRPTIPDMIHVSNEDIIRVLAPIVLGQENMITKALFNSTFRASILQRFEGLAGCWDEKNKKGTNFFWHRRNNRHEALFVHGGELRNEDASFSVPLEENAIISALKSQDIIPGLFVIYGWILFYCGVRPLVGYGSLNYVTQMKMAWLDVLRGGADDEERARVQSVDTLGMIGGLLVSFKRSENGKLANQYALDLLYDGGMKREYLEHMLQMKFNDLLGPALLDIYASWIPAHMRKAHSLTSNDLLGASFDWIQ